MTPMKQANEARRNEGSTPATVSNEKTWVVVQFTDGRRKVWRDYGEVAWGSPAYTVLGYFEGSHREAVAHARTVEEESV